MSEGTDGRNVGAGRAWPGWLLGNGRYSLLITAAGAGCSRFAEHALTAWSGDWTRDAEGVFIYVRDLDDGHLWSAGFQPTRRPPTRYDVRHTGACVEIAREDHGIETRTEVCVAADDALELRRCSLTNTGRGPRRLELTTYAPLALDRPRTYAAHPAFSKLFVQTAYWPRLQALHAWRRPRAAEEGSLHLVHLLVPCPAATPPPRYETDRARFLGRGRSLERPGAMEDEDGLGAGVGAVLDPVFALRRTVEIRAGATARFVALLGAAWAREQVEALAERYSSPSQIDAAIAAARARSPAEGGPEAAAGVLRPDGEAALAEATRITALATEPAPRYWPACAGDASGGEPVLNRWGDEELVEFNGYGGFAATGSEYVIRLGHGARGLRPPPLPWINVIANEQAGFLASEGGAGYTWCLNSREHRLTPWHNDPLTDPHGEALYVRDEEDLVFWSPTPGPVPGPGPYETRHGFGYTRYRHSSRGLDQDVWQYVPRRDAIKVIRVRLVNRSGRRRRLSVFGYYEWVLGGPSERRWPPVVTEHDAECGALLARNPAAGPLAERVAFATVVAPGGGRVHVSGDRCAFLGRYGSPAEPAALRLAPQLDGRTGEGLDPCAAIQAPLWLDEGATVELAFLLGEAGSLEEARALVRQYRDMDVVRAALDEVSAFWKELVSGCQVDTGVPSIDLMVNGWLPYQVLTCRIWGRSALYQSGGAFGFRDQLQDAAALIPLLPDLCRGQIVLHAAHQFTEGDVLHWWHPPVDIGIRTRFSDDLLWLPYITAHYVGTTGDDSVLDEMAPFLTARALEPGEDEARVVPRAGDESGTVFEHCCRAIDRSLPRGAHGLPLMGSGDWNDGMNRVGREGRGESVWLGFLLFDALRRWIPLCEARGAAERARRYRERAGELQLALNAAGWDGGWYRRAFYDDGAPLGSAESDECRIDAIAQAWAVMSGAAPADRAQLAMSALEQHLVSEDDELIRLLVPPFDRTLRDPGYIKGYLPGVRENGGQYTHAALWAVDALAKLGRTERAARLLEMLSPVSHAGTPERIATYRAEPYVIAADVYGAPPHVGRGGWTWYTGSAGWMYRVALESILGLRIEAGETLAVRPCIPTAWPGYRARYRLDDGRTVYEIAVSRAADGDAETAAWLDDGRVTVEDGAALIPLVRDGRRHHAVVRLGRDAEPRYAPAPPVAG